MFSIRYSLVFAGALLLSSCEMASNAVSSSASEFVSSQTSAISSQSKDAFLNASSAAGTSVGSSY
ncbi:MAG: hypothetical protein VX335_05615 [Pseudomonadota bacterium]|nr:hypothetical protein [Pseudomonadota bacterium]